MNLTVCKMEQSGVVVCDEAVIVVMRKSSNEMLLGAGANLCMVLGGTLAVAMGVGGGNLHWTDGLFGVVVGAIMGVIIRVVGRPILSRIEARKARAPRSTDGWREATEVIYCNVSDLSRELTENPEWPPAEPFRPASIYPRAAVGRATMLKLKGLQLTLKKKPVQPVTLTLSPGCLDRVRRHLVAANYPLKN
jgi:hypothetical protein